MTEKNEEKSIEKEIIASYLQGLSTLAIRKEYDISEFELAYILGKHNVPARQCYRKVGDDTTIVYADGGVRIPKNPITVLGLEHGHKICCYRQATSNFATAGNKVEDLLTLKA